MEGEEGKLLFSDVRFYIAQCHDTDTIKSLLIDGGAKYSDYMLESVTHVIADTKCPEAEGAIEVYEKPVVNSLWVHLSLKAKALLPPVAFSPFNCIFNNVIASISNDLTEKDREILAATLSYYGAKITKDIKSSTHFIVPSATPSDLPSNDLIVDSHLNIVAPDWVLDSIEQKTSCQEQLYDPSLLLGPPPPTPSPLLVEEPTVEEKSQKSEKQTSLSNNERKIEYHPIQNPSHSLPRPQHQSHRQPTPSMQQQQSQQFQMQSQQRQQVPASQIPRVRMTNRPNTNLPPRGPGFRPVMPPNSSNIPMHQQVRLPTNQFNQPQPQSQLQPPRVILSNAEPNKVRLAYSQFRKVAPYQNNMDMQQPQQHSMQPHQIPQQQPYPPQVQHHGQVQQQPPRMPNMQQSQIRPPQQNIYPQQPAMPYQNNHMQPRSHQPMLNQPPQTQQQPQQMMNRIQDPNTMPPRQPVYIQANPQQSMPPQQQQQQQYHSGNNNRQYYYNQQNPNQNMQVRMQPTQQHPPPPMHQPVQSSVPMMYGEINPMAQQAQHHHQHSHNVSPVGPHHHPQQQPMQGMQDPTMPVMQPQPPHPSNTHHVSPTHPQQPYPNVVQHQQGMPLQQSPLQHSPSHIMGPQQQSPIQQQQQQVPISPNHQTRPPVPNMVATGPQQVRAARASVTPNHSSETRQISPRTRGITPAANNQLIKTQKTPPNSQPHPSIFDHKHEVNLAQIKAKVPVVKETYNYVGHEAGVVVPTNRPLTGCKFVIIDEDDTSASLKAKWRSAIKAAGGSVVDKLENATHLVCDNRLSDEYAQAIKLGVRCITFYWINDVLNQNHLSYPWKALHIPLPYARTNQPLVGHLVSITNLRGRERKHMADMLMRVGARYTDHFSAKNSLLICGNVSGEKYDRAIEWKTPIANCQIISDILLSGNKDLKSMLTQSKYQIFNRGDPLKLKSYSLVLDIMEPWLKPILVKEATGESSDANALNSKTLTESINGSTELLSKADPLPVKSHDDSGIATGNSNGSEQDTNTEKSDPLDSKRREAPVGDNPDKTNELDVKPKIEAEKTIIKLENEDKPNEPGVKMDVDEEFQPALESLDDITPSLVTPTDNTGETLLIDFEDDSTKPNNRDTGTTLSVEGQKSQVANVKPLRKSDEPVRLLFTHLNQDLKDQLKLYASKLELSFATSPTNCTHLVVDGISRTTKFVCALNHAKYVLSYRWLIESYEANALLDENAFYLEDKEGEEKYCFNLIHTLFNQRKRRGLLFDNFIFFVTPRAKAQAIDVKEMIESAGGLLATRKLPSRMQIDQMNKENKRFVVVTCEDDLHLCISLAEYGVNFVSIEFIVSGILRQDYDFEAHRIKSDLLPERPQVNNKLTINNKSRKVTSTVGVQNKTTPLLLPPPPPPPTPSTILQQKDLSSSSRKPQASPAKKLRFDDNLTTTH